MAATAIRVLKRVPLKPARPRLPAPANDNTPLVLPRPANDNFPPIPTPPGLPRGLQGWIAKKGLGLGLKPLLGPLGWALAAYDLWELYRWWVNYKKPLPDGWVVEFDHCGGGDVWSGNRGASYNLCSENYYFFASGIPHNPYPIDHTDNYVTGYTYSRPGNAYGDYWWRGTQYKRVSGTLTWSEPKSGIMPRSVPRDDPEPLNNPFANPLPFTPPAPLSQSPTPYYSPEDAEWDLAQAYPPFNPWLNDGEARTLYPTPVPYKYVPLLPAISPGGDVVRGPLAPPRQQPEWIRPNAFQPDPRFLPRPDTLPNPFKYVVVPDYPGPQKPDPKRDPKRKKKDRTRPTPRQRPWRAVPQYRDPELFRDPDPAPSEKFEPALKGTFEPGRPPNVTNRGKHRLQRPRSRREKERKVYGHAKLRGLVWWAANIVTEACDTVDAMYDAIPFKRKRLYEKKLARYGSFRNWEAYQFHQRNVVPEWAREENQLFQKAGGACRAKAFAVWQEFDEIDLGEAMWNWVIQQMMDTVQGQLTRSANEGFLKNVQRPVGLTGGPAL